MLKNPVQEILHLLSTKQENTNMSTYLTAVQRPRYMSVRHIALCYMQPLGWHFYIPFKRTQLPTRSGQMSAVCQWRITTEQIRWKSFSCKELLSEVMFWWAKKRTLLVKTYPSSNKLRSSLHWVEHPWRSHDLRPVCLTSPWPATAGK